AASGWPQPVLRPARRPAGAAVLWLKLQELRFAPLRDAADELDVTGGWSKDLADGYARRVLARVARHAPDLHRKLLSLDIVTPSDLVAYNLNTVAGDPYGGPTQLDQQPPPPPLPRPAPPPT